MSPPSRISINHDEYAAKHIGCLPDGRQFFLTSPFEPAWKDRKGGEYIALYLWDELGNFLEAKVEGLGPRSELDMEHARASYYEILDSLGQIEFKRINVAPFSIERFGVEFGLVLREPEEDGDAWAVEAQPGNYMAFFEPWDSGYYDT
ncbi:hypothetical protein [Cerasicoccus fimbriatus]|uniref:hypothetical protein n=1 Tax=Cerasicoccus fimbriatus TaxID=3014554 RepID=UPI0022B347FE|nr:hypothetical protein [Cerasicoccus sp. TK19100]